MTACSDAKLDVRSSSVDVDLHVVDGRGVATRLNESTATGRLSSVYIQYDLRLLQAFVARMCPSGPAGSRMP